MGYKLNRRAFLAGVGGTVVALPMLEVMGDGNKAAADGLGRPCRYVVAYGGTSARTENLVPSSAGPGLEMTRGLAVLAGHRVTELAPPGLEYNTTLTSGLDHDNVLGEFSLVSDLKIPWETAGSVPAGGRIREFHGSTLGPNLTGIRCTERSSRARGTSSDQIVADQIAGETRFKSLEYRIQVQNYRGSTGTGSVARMSFRDDGTGRIRSNEPVVSPRVAYDQLFRGFTPDDPAEAARREFELAQDRSVLDLVRESSQRLMGRLGSSDQRRMERYFDEVRDLERRVREIPDAPMGACHLLPDPGNDPSVRIRHCSEDPGNDCRYEFIDGWADEESRARVMCDLIHMALTCDQTRVATLLMTFPQSFLNMSSVLGYNLDVHGLGHNGGSERRVADVVGWHLKHLAYLVDKLRNTPEGSGTLLDHTALCFLMEGGWGEDPEGGRSSSAHSSENMMAFIAGRAGGLSPGQHVRATGMHPANVLITAMHAVGVDGDLGEVSGEIPGLRG